MPFYVVACFLFMIAAAIAADPYSNCASKIAAPETVSIPEKAPRDLQLVLVHSLWRHGDRWPTNSFDKDPIQDANWTGGFGQLSPCGMAQHLALGKLLRRYLIDEMQILSTNFDARQIYVRSTDVNRTIVSAMANLIGMYSTENLGISGWPVNYVPIPVHTVPYETDYVLNTGARCRRQDQLQDLLNSTKDMQYMWGNTSVLCANLSVHTGQKIDVYALGMMRDAINIELEYFSNSVPPWYSELQFDTQHLYDIVENYQNGYGLNDPTVNDIDLSLQIPRIKGGPFLNDLVARMQQKLDCHGKSSQDTSCQWMDELRYYAYSAHDTIMAAVLTILGAKNATVPFGNPDYASTLLWELYTNRSSDDEPVFRLLFRKDVQSGLDSVTKFVTGCETDFCPFSSLKLLAHKYDPGDIERLCSTDLGAASNSASCILCSHLLAAVVIAIVLLASYRPLFG